MAGKKTTIRLLLSTITADRNQYKPYVSVLASPLEKPVYVEIDVPTDELVSEEPVVITAAGLAAVLGNVASAIEVMHNEYKDKIMTPSKPRLNR